MPSATKVCKRAQLLDVLVDAIGVELAHAAHDLVELLRIHALLAQHVRAAPAPRPASGALRRGTAGCRRPCSSRPGRRSPQRPPPHAPPRVSPPPARRPRAPSCWPPPPGRLLPLLALLTLLALLALLTSGPGPADPAGLLALLAPLAGLALLALAGPADLAARPGPAALRPPRWPRPCCPCRARSSMRRPSDSALRASSRARSTASGPRAWPMRPAASTACDSVWRS